VYKGAGDDLYNPITGPRFFRIFSPLFFPLAGLILPLTSFFLAGAAPDHDDGQPTDFVANTALRFFTVPAAGCGT
jgi:hypothetical protein